MSIIDRMDRDQLLIAAFYSTPNFYRFIQEDAINGTSTADRCGAMAFRGITLQDFDDAVLKAYITNNQTNSRSGSAEANDELQSAYARAIRNLAARAVA